MSTSLRIVLIVLSVGLAAICATTLLLQCPEAFPTEIL